MEDLLRWFDRVARGCWRVSSRRPLFLVGWRTVLGVFLLLILPLLANDFMGRRATPFLMLNEAYTAGSLAVLFAWIAPLPWRYMEGRGGWRIQCLRILLAVLACGITLVAFVLGDAWFKHAAGMRFSLWKVLYFYLTVYGPLMMVVGALVTAHSRAEWENEQIREEALLAQTRLLQSQLHPHVLFNALNGLAELIHRDPPQAERSLRSLSDLLRRILRASESSILSLGEERALVEDYLALESLRLGKRLKLGWEWDPSLDRFKVAPLLLQPLVENAIKHGITPHPPGGELLIRAQEKDREIWLEVRNTGAPLGSRRGGGLGLRNLEARLPLVHGPEARFQISSVNGWTVAMVRLPKERYA